MKDHPILFSGAMVRALLAGTKTQTRRVIKPQPEHLQVYDWKGKRLHDSEYRHWCWKGHVGADNWDDITAQLGPFLPYQTGDQLYVRETWVHTGAGVWTVADAMRWPGRSQIRYRADGQGPADQWFPSIHMPRWASRITLTVTNVRIERVQDISEEDANAEGAEPTTCANAEPPQDGFPSHRSGFALLWNSLNAARGYGWDANPWVVAVTFATHLRNIDDPEAA